MAVITATKSHYPEFTDDVLMVTWSNLTFTGLDSGDPLQMPRYADRSVQITGTFGTGTIVFEGSNDGTNYVTLTDPAGGTHSYTAAGLKNLVEITRYVRPRVTAGNGTTSLTCTLLVRKMK